MAIRIAIPSDFSGIVDLWGEAFGDSPKAVSFFFRTFPNCLSYVIEEKGRIVSMVHALPRILSPERPAAYVYAVATAQTHRGRGLCRQLMAFAEEDLKQRGFACCVLTPGEPSLFRFYEALGYETAFFRQHTPFSGGRPISAAAYAALRERVLTVPHMVCDLPTLEYAAAVYGLTFYETDTGCAAVGETYTTEVLPEDLGGTPFAMCKWLGEPQTLPPAYLGFALE